jgi:hypothetical protein
MRLIQTSHLNQNALVFNYVPAKLCKNHSGWLIEYYVENPISYEMCRVRRRVQFLKKRYGKGWSFFRFILWSFLIKQKSKIKKKS